MSDRRYRTAPTATDKMPPGVPYIVGNEAAERFSFYGMKGILIIFMANYLHYMDDVAGIGMSETRAREESHWFIAAAYFTPLLGAFIADVIGGKYRTIIALSIVYCLGHGALAMMGTAGSAQVWLLLGLTLVALGSGGIKPCVSAHVGDQFGPSNRHLLTRVFNWFYWSINLGSLLSTIATPWLLHWYGPHWAFGVPGVLMLLATIIFWMGRWKFIHVPPKRAQLLKEITSKEGIAALGKLSVVFVFIAMFWSLFDQTGSAWVLQAESMDRNFLGIEWLPSQIQSLNPVLILIFVPLFSYGLYPFLNRFFELKPMRKISIGLFLMVVGFAISSYTQEMIDAGSRPSIGWQLLGFILVTASEVMVSIVGLEFFYTQAPRAMKSITMAIFLFAVSLGNVFTAKVNHYIQIPDRLAAMDELRTGNQTVINHTGLDRKKGTDDDIQIFYDGDGKRAEVNLPAAQSLKEARKIVEAKITANNWEVPSNEAGATALAGISDPWGNALRYTVVNSHQCRISSYGPDKVYGTEWDSGIVLKVALPDQPVTGWFVELVSKFRPDEPWLDSRKRELNIPIPASGVDAVPEIASEKFVGGQARLEGAAYFWFFTWVMLGTAVLFLFVVFFYKPREYFHEEEDIAEAKAEFEN